MRFINRYTQTLGFVLPPPQRLKFYLLALSASLSRSVFTLAQSIAQPNLKDKFHSQNFEI
nr:hypothetical protein [uncultured Campylobacter sp.]